MRVRWNGIQRLIPGEGYEFFKENPEAYSDLKRQEIVDMPEEVFADFKNCGVEKEDGRGRKKSATVENVVEYAPFEETKTSSKEGCVNC